MQYFLIRLLSNSVIRLLVEGAPLITMLFWSSLRLSHSAEAEETSEEHSQHGFKQKEEEVKLRLKGAQELIEFSQGYESCSCLSVLC